MIPRDPSAPAPVAVMAGHGVGPEIMEATLRILDAAGARLDLREVRCPSDPKRTDGAMEEAADAARAAGVLLKGPVAGGRSEPLRRGLGLFCHVRRATALDPVVPSRAPGMDLLVIRESEEDVYGGLEHRQTHDVAQCIKLVTRPAAERFVRTAFAWARAAGRSRLTCVTKANVLRLTDGLFHDVFKEIAAENPDMAADHMIADAAAAKLVEAPERFDVIVAPNLYGDILGDLAAQLAGRPALTPSARIGVDAAVFEPVHGPAMPLAGKLVANPAGLLLSAVKMLRFVGQDEASSRVRDAWLRTIEDGVHTPDLHRAGVSKRRVSTRIFTQEV
ncbi:MAG: isocitrate/isopropylmalate family dehydrogenase, partial [Pseudomonadota bacterium]